MDEQSRREEDDLAARQDGRLYPLGRVLRSTYDADNHETLGSDVTGLMLDLARVPYEPSARDGVAAAPTCARDAVPGTAEVQANDTRGSGWFGRMREYWSAR